MTTMGSDQTRGASITLTEVGVQYQTDEGPVPALSTSSVHISSGEFVSIVGPSGCGKSTMLKVIAGLLRPTEGTVAIENGVVEEPYESMGIVFQEPVLLDWRTILGNVMLQADVRRLEKKQLEVRARELLSQVGLEEFVDKRPYELSGGMRQRASICRALVHNPSLLLMDEPFGALDALTREQMNEDLQDLWTKLGMTVFFVTHSIPEAVTLSDRVLVMSSRPGSILADVSIDLPRPRKVQEVRSTHKYLEYTTSIRAILDRGSTDLPAQRASEANR